MITTVEDIVKRTMLNASYLLTEWFLGFVKGSKDI